MGAQLSNFSDFAIGQYCTDLAIARKGKKRPSGSKWIRGDKRLAIYLRDGFACIYCEKSHDLSLDHVVPWSLGGLNTENNLITSCRRCNSTRGTRQILEFAGMDKLLKIKGLLATSPKRFDVLRDFAKETLVKNRSLTRSYILIRNLKENNKLRI